MPELPVEIEAWAFELDKLDLPASSHPSEVERAEKIADPIRRLRHERGRSALRQVLAGRLGCGPGTVEFKIAKGGKPFVDGCEFSISHSGSWLFVAVSNIPVGVDIEVKRSHLNAMKIAERFFSPRDICSLREAAAENLDRAFMRQWVAKEAALKCEGVGLALHLHKAEFVEEPAPAVRWDAAQFSIHEFALPDGTPGALAWRGDGDARVHWRDAAKLNVS